MNVEVLDDAEALATRAAQELARAIAAAGTAHGFCRLALSGGDTPRRMLEVLAERPDVDWSRVGVYQVDERLAPKGHPDRNLTMIEEALLATVTPGEVHAMPVEDLGHYDVPDLDVVHLGLGADGHTASLVPGDPVLTVRDRDVSLTGDYEGRRRMTMTVPAIDRARLRLWVVAGAGKADALTRLLRADPAIPASLIRREGTLVLADRTAAGIELADGRAV